MTVERVIFLIQRVQPMGYGSLTTIEFAVSYREAHVFGP
jgi:hypothetical protein